MVNSILDKFISTSSAFRPRTVQDVFALRLACKLGDASASRHYAQLAAQHSEGTLLAVYRRTVRGGQRTDLGRRFHAQLESFRGNGANGSSFRLLALRVERRCVAGAVFYGSHLEYTDLRQLSSSKDKALGSGVSFVNWLFDRFEVDSAAMEVISNGDEIHRRMLSEIVADAVRQRLLPIWKVPKTEVFESFGYPSARCRRQAREVVTDIWPVLAGTGAKVFVQDAVALGLHIQTKRLFIT